jgi:pyruvate/2-oxoglutarate dehydrogenase complex dihydrolipoamide acyltransferase (E2) component
MEVEALNAGTLLAQLVAPGEEACAGDVLTLLGTAETSTENAGTMLESEQTERPVKYNRDFLLRWPGPRPRNRKSCTPGCLDRDLRT